MARFPRFVGNSLGREGVILSPREACERLADPKRFHEILFPVCEISRWFDWVTDLTVFDALQSGRLVAWLPEVCPAGEEWSHAVVPFNQLIDWLSNRSPTYH